MKTMKNILLFCFCLWSGIIVAQSTGRPKIGLVLSGGGAKGFAHIGVLKVLEEVGIQPDYITGTSMGSILGGLYAIGYRADNMHQMVAAQDWNLLMNDRVDLNEVIFEEKSFFKNELVELPLEDWAVKAPTGAIHGQKIEELLAELTLPVYQISDFDDFQIPFRCLAVDVVKGTPVELKGGYLADAMRTSMAIPTVFTAVKRDSQVLVDGGLIRNFPVEEAKNMGADIIIAVYTGAPVSDYASLNSFTDILMQSAFLMSIKDHEAQMPLVDYYIAPDLAEFSAADFQSFEGLIEAGEIAARKQIEELQALANQLNELGETPSLKPMKVVDSLFIDAIEIRGNKTIASSEIFDYLEPLLGRKIVSADLQEAIESLFGTDLFNKVTYRLLNDELLLVLQVRCEEKALNILSTSLIYDSYSNAGLLFAASTRNTILPASRTMFIGKIADNFSAKLTLLKYLGKNRDKGFFAQIGVQRSEIPIYELGEVASQFRILEVPFDLRWQRRIQNNSLLKAGFRHNILYTDPIAGRATEVFDDVRYRSSSFYVGFEHNSLNRNVFPDRGVRLTIEGYNTFDDQFSFTQLSNPEGLQNIPAKSGDYHRINIQLESFLPISVKSSLKFNAYWASVNNTENTFADFYLLGSPEKTTERSIPFYGLDANELPVRSVLGLNFGYQSFFAPNWMLSLDVNAASLAYPETFSSSGDDQFFLGGIGLSIACRTFLGPLQFSLMYPFDTDDVASKRFRSYLNFGYKF